MSRTEERKRYLQPKAKARKQLLTSQSPNEEVITCTDSLVHVNVIGSWSIADIICNLSKIATSLGGGVHQFWSTNSIRRPPFPSYGLATWRWLWKLREIFGPIVFRCHHAVQLWAEKGGVIAPRLQAPVVEPVWDSINRELVFDLTIWKWKG